MTDADILRLWRAGLATAWIAAHFGVKEHVIANRLMGIRVRAKFEESLQASREVME